MTMNYRQVKLNISDEQRQQLIEHNVGIANHIERRLALEHTVVSGLAEELSKAVEQMPEMVEVLAEINDQQRHTHVRLMDDDAEILNLPWAMAIDPASGQPLGEIAKLHLSKCPERFIADTARELTAPVLKILVMISSPENVEHRGRLSYEEEERLILAAFGPLLESGLVEIDFTDEGSLETLQEKLKKNKYHILHYSGHALFKDGQASLQLEDHLTMNSRIVSEKAFAQAVTCNPEHTVPLVVLSSCQTAQGLADSEKGFCGVTNRLLQMGVSTVISMGMSILDHYASVFCAHFYGQIADKQGILQSFHSAREHLRQQEWEDRRKANIAGGAAIQWMIPNLYSRDGLDQLVDWDKASEKIKSSSYRFIFEQGRLLLTHDDDYRFIGRRRDKAKILPLLAKKLPIQLRGQGGMGKTAMAEHLIQRLFTSNTEIHPFLFNEKSKTLQDIQKVLQSYLDEKGVHYIQELQLREKGMDEFIYLAAEAGKVCQPVFVFDNLETFQEGLTERFAQEFEDIAAVIGSLCKDRRYHVI
ncbi:MAG TPA: CHAT domain-containing protein, partial [Phycisphaerales bacterium]|nr:CHAT domain-containing protein [Phycisphaerales bacterium]